MIKKGRKVGGERMSVLDILKGDIDPLTKRIVFTGILTREVEKEGFSPVIGGNYAVELYTSGGYKADTVDLLIPVDLADSVLSRWSFERGDSGWSNEDIGIAVRSLGEDLGKSELERVNQIDVNGLAVYLLGVEDLIIDKLAEYTRHGESDAILWAQELMEIHINELDLDYLKVCASNDGVMRALQQLIDELGLDEEKRLNEGKLNS